MMEIPTITMTKRESDGKTVLRCDAIDCKWEEIADNPGQIAEHQTWHEDGMPE